MLPQWVQTPKRQREGEGVDPGFLFSRPLEAERLIEWLAEQKESPPAQTKAAWRLAAEIDTLLGGPSAARSSQWRERSIGNADRS